MSFPYSLRHSVFNRSEAAFFMQLSAALVPNFYVFTKIRLIDFLELTSKTDEFSWTHRIWAKHVDFLICDLHFKPVLAIEVNGKSHVDPERIERDEFVRGVFQGVGLPFKVVDVGQDFTKSVKEILLELN